MRTILTCIFLLTLVKGIEGQCYSSCDNSCAGYCIDCCTVCSAGLIVATDSKCVGMPPLTVLSLVDDSWPTLYAPYLNYITDQTLTMYTSGTAAGLSSTSGLQLTTSNYIVFDLGPIDTHFQITVRASVDLSTEPGCLFSYLSLSWWSSFLIPPNFYATSPIFLGSSTEVLSLSFYHSMSMDQFQLAFDSSSGLSCTYITLRDVSFIVELCSPTCKTCIDLATCSSCGVSTNGQQFLSTSWQCVDTFTTTYVINSGLDLFLCDQCHVACLNCSQINDANFCLACNNAVGYVWALNSSSTCSLGCPQGQFVNNTAPRACYACDLNCKSCKNLPTQCTACGLDTTSSQMYLKTVSSTCSTVCPKSYYTDGINAFICDKCDIACIRCTGFTNSTCTACNNTYGYVFALNASTTCVLGCPSDQFINTTFAWTCNLCNSNCQTCETTESNCLSCGNATSGQPLYLTLAHTCSSTCPLSYYSDGLTFFECDRCDAACIACSGLTNSSCQSCNNSGGYVFALNASTTCVLGCPPGQFINTTLPWTCNECDPSCQTCGASKSNCLSCGTDTTGQQLYLTLTQTCSPTCPLSYYSDGLTFFECDKCDIACLTCFGLTNSSCQSCNNSSGYYFALNLPTTCTLGCPIHQFLSLTVPLRCLACSSNCRTCQNTSISCTTCSLTAGRQMYLVLSNHTCSLVCPSSYYTDGLYGFTCDLCHEACVYCTAVNDSSACSSCNNNKGYYFSFNSTSHCVFGCNTSEFLTGTQLTCTPCALTCLTCSISSGNCTSCPTTLYFYNFTCVSSCPLGSLANANNICIFCEYYLFGGECIEQCPLGYTGFISSVSTCNPCSQKTCSTEDIKSFTVSSRVANQNVLEHQVALSEGLSSNSTETQLKQGLKVVITSGARRLLLSATTLTVQGLTISTNNMYIYILTNYVPVSLTSSSVTVTFKAGALVTASGTSYNQLTSSVSLSSSPSFIKSYYETFSNYSYQQAQGIIFILLSFLLLLSALFWLRDFKFQHECMALIQMIQIIGLSRIRQLPFEFDFYNVLVGYSHFALGFVPNKWADIFASANYSEVTIDSAAFSLGSQNFIINYGSIFYLYIPLQLILLIFFLIYRNNEMTFAFFKNIQEYLINLWSIIVIYGTLLCLLSVQYNQITSQNMHYAVTILISFIILGAYGVYFGFIIKNHLQAQLYKINNVVRVIGLLMLAHGQNAALLVINFSELFFIAVDVSLYRSQKINAVLNFIQKGLFLVVINSCLIQVNFQALLAIAGICFGSMTLFRCYYLAKIAVEKCKEMNQEAERLKIHSNASMDFSISEKVQFDKEHEEVKFARNGENGSKTPELNKVSSHQTLISPSIVFQESPHYQIKIEGSINELHQSLKDPTLDPGSQISEKLQIHDLRPQMKDPSLDAGSQNFEELQLTVKRRRTRLEPVIVRENRQAIRSEADQMEIINVEGLSEMEKSEKQSEKQSEPQEQVWK